MKIYQNIKMDFDENEINLNWLEDKNNKNINIPIEDGNYEDSKCRYALIPQSIFQSKPINKNIKGLQRDLKTNNNKINLDKVTYNENFIKQIRFVPNNKELILVTNKNQIVSNYIDMDRILTVSNDEYILENNNDYEEIQIQRSNILYQENNYIYDIEMYYE